MIKINSWNETLTDAQKMCNIEGLIAHDYIPDPQEIMNSWMFRDIDYFHDKLIAYLNDRVVGCIHINQARKENSHIVFDFFVDPQFQNQGIGTQLYNELLRCVKKIKCTHLLSYGYDHPNWKSGKKFLLSHGFEHISTNREYELKLNESDFSQFNSVIDQIKGQGFTFLEPVKQGVNSNNHYKKLEELRWDFFKDMPYPKGIIPTRPNYDLWIKEHQNFEKENYGIELILLSPEGEYIGCTKLSKDQAEPDKCWTDNLGVRKDYRRKKLATALKIEALSRLKEEFLRFELIMKRIIPCIKLMLI